MPLRGSPPGAFISCPVTVLQDTHRAGRTLLLVLSLRIVLEATSTWIDTLKRIHPLHTVGRHHVTPEDPGATNRLDFYVSRGGSHSVCSRRPAPGRAKH